MRTYTYIVALMVGLASCRPAPQKETPAVPQDSTTAARYVVRDDFKQYYDSAHVEGSFALYNPGNSTYIQYNPAQFRQGFSPASTFKICNSLIGLETGVIQDADHLLKWDGVKRRIPDWNQDHTLRSAFKASTVWYYQELARQVGGEKMKFWLDKADYGNADTSGGIDQFWLSGGLRVTPEEQIDFLQRLHDGTLPFSQRSMDIVKDIMVAEDTLGHVLRAKTGWSIQGAEVGWYVGYFEARDSVYYFANCIQTTDSLNPGFGQARKDITFAILDELGLRKR